MSQREKISHLQFPAIQNPAYLQQLIKITIKITESPNEFTHRTPQTDFTHALWQEVCNLLQSNDLVKLQIPQGLAKLVNKISFCNSDKTLTNLSLPIVDAHFSCFFSPSLPSLNTHHCSSTNQDSWITGNGCSLEPKRIFPK